MTGRSTAKSVSTLLWLIVIMACGQVALAEGQNGQWTMPGGDWRGGYYSPLAGIDEKNVAATTEKVERPNFSPPS
jgi:hypothetical protein